MDSRRTRLLVPVLLSTAGLAVAGCGGGGGGDESAYVKTYQDACAKISSINATAQKSLQTQVLAAGDNRARIVEIVKTGTSKAFGEISTEVKRLENADPPSKYQDFQESIQKALKPVSASIDDAGKKLASAKTIQDVIASRSLFRGLDISEPKIPKDLEEKISTCRFGTSATG